MPVEPAELRALLRLLDDGDETVGIAVEQRLIGYGDDALQHVHPLLESSDAIVRSRAQRIVETITSSRPIEEFTMLADMADAGAHDIPLAVGCVALARTAYPAYAARELDDALSRFARVLERRLEMCSTDGARLQATIQYFYAEELFAGNVDDYYNPDNSFINRVIDTRRGIPISLAATLLLLARRVHLPITGVNMPAHFLLRYRTAKIDTFIDPFLGRVLSHDDMRTMAEKMDVSDLERALAEPSDKAMLLRMMNNAINAYERRNDSLHAHTLRRCLEILTR